MLKSAVILGAIAITSEYREESQPDGSRESGCRVQLRLVSTVPAPVPPPVPRRDAVFWSIEEPVWRADLFSEVDGSGPYDTAHYHPTFTGLTPCKRVFDDTIQPDPLRWISRRLADVPGMLTEAGRPELVDQFDAAAARHAMPAVVATIEATPGYRPADGAPG